MGTLLTVALLSSPPAPSSAPAPSLAPRLRLSPGLQAPPAPLALRSPGAGGSLYLDPARSSGVDGGVACIAGAILPGLGHAVLGAYLPRGLAFTTAFFSTAIGGIAAIAHAQDSPLLRGQLLFAGLVLMIAAEVVYVWSVIDTLNIAAQPRRRPRSGRARILGAD